MNDVAVALIVMAVLAVIGLTALLIDRRQSDRGESDQTKLHRAALRHFAELGEMPTSHDETSYIAEILFDPAAEEAILHPPGEEILHLKHDEHRGPSDGTVRELNELPDD